MASAEQGSVIYKRARFSTRLPGDRRYTASHAWISERGDGLRCVGFTKFAIRLLGEPVEFDVEVEPDTEVELGQVIGWIEGFKAVTDLFCPLAGRFCAPNPELTEDISLLQSDPYGRGWLYSLHGTPGDDCIDVAGYAAILDATIDKMMGTSQ